MAHSFDVLHFISCFYLQCNGYSVFKIPQTHPYTKPEVNY